MSKRSFRNTPAPKSEKPSYPTLQDFDRQSRRAALLRLGGAIGAALFGAAALAGCGDRKISLSPDAGSNLPPPDGGGSIDSMSTQGVVPPFDARADVKPPQPEPDARILAGDVPGPDARIEEPDMGIAGGAPLPPAQLDAGKK